MPQPPSLNHTNPDRNKRALVQTKAALSNTTIHLKGVHNIIYDVQVADHMLLFVATCITPRALTLAVRIIQFQEPPGYRGHTGWSTVPVNKRQLYRFTLGPRSTVSDLFTSVTWLHCEGCSDRE